MVNQENLLVFIADAQLNQAVVLCLHIYSRCSFCCKIKHYIEHFLQVIEKILYYYDKDLNCLGYKYIRQPCHCPLSPVGGDLASGTFLERLPLE